MDYKKLYLEYKSKYSKLKNVYTGKIENQHGGGPTNAALFLMTDIPNKDGTKVRHLVLLMNRKMAKGKLSGLRYSVPGGHIDRGENAFQAMKREYKEETGTELPRLDGFKGLKEFAKMNYNGHTMIYIATCNYNEIGYIPSKVKNNETCGLILYPCEQLKNQLNKILDDEYPYIKLRTSQLESTKKIFSDYLDAQFEIVKTD